MIHFKVFRISGKWFINFILMLESFKDKKEETLMEEPIEMKFLRGKSISEKLLTTLDDIRKTEISWDFSISSDFYTDAMSRGRHFPTIHTMKSDIIVFQNDEITNKYVLAFGGVKASINVIGRLNYLFMTRSGMGELEDIAVREVRLDITAKKLEEFDSSEVVTTFIHSIQNLNVKEATLFGRGIEKAGEIEKFIHRQEGKISSIRFKLDFERVFTSVFLSENGIGSIAAFSQSEENEREIAKKMFRKLLRCKIVDQENI